VERHRWTRWSKFPNPRKGEFIRAPFGPGLYELRRSDTRKLVLIGIGKNCAYRASSLLSPPWGAGTRNNSAKVEYVTKNLSKIEYRCLACSTKEEAQKIETELRRSNDYIYST
jgi:hypothetical protein